MARLQQLILALAAAWLVAPGVAAQAAPVQLSDSVAVLGPDAIANFPAADTDLTTGRTLVTWVARDQRGGGSQVYGRFVDAAGAPAGGQFAISPGIPANRAARVAYDGRAGRFIVVWEDASSGALLARSAAPGPALGPVGEVAPAGTRPFDFVLAGSRTNGVLAGWATIGARIQVRRLRSGLPAGPARAIAPAKSHTLGLAAARGGWFASYVIPDLQPPSGQLRVRRLSVGGRGRGGSRAVHPTPPAGRTTFAAAVLRAGAGGRALVLWAEQVIARNVMRARIVDSKGRPARRIYTVRDAGGADLRIVERPDAIPAGRTWHVAWGQRVPIDNSRPTTLTLVTGLLGSSAAPRQRQQATTIADYPEPNEFAFAARRSGGPMTMIATHLRRREESASPYFQCGFPPHPCVYATQEILSETG